MAEPTLSADYEELRRVVARYNGLDRDPGVWSADETTDMTDMIRAGLRKFLTPPVLPRESTPHLWSFLKPIATITTSASYNDGTIAIAAGVVTLTAATVWPTWAAEGEVTIHTTATTYTVATRDSDTQLTLDDTSVTVAAGATYTLGRPTYALPDDFSVLMSPFTYQPGITYFWGPIQTVGEWQIRTRRQGSDWVSRPRLAAVRPSAKSTSTGNRWEVMFWPTPDDDYTLTYRYRVVPDMLTDPGNMYAYGMPIHAEAIKASCLAAAELEYDGQQGSLHQNFMEQITRAIGLDRMSSSPDELGLMIDLSDEVHEHQFHGVNQHIVRYEGQVTE